jgi:3-hydroxyisobutyrate dehydrogenase-like beta-hydroxyacid dehydrogenase
MAKVAWIGFGVIGYPLAGHIRKGGHELTLYNRTATKADAWVRQHGGRTAATPAEAARDAEFVFCCLGNDGDLRQIGETGAFQAVGKGDVFIDNTTASGDPLRPARPPRPGQGHGDDLQGRRAAMAAGKLDFGFAVDWMRKDLGICLGGGQAQRRAPGSRRWSLRLRRGPEDGRRAVGHLEPDCPAQRQILRRVDPGSG